MASPNAERAATAETVNGSQRNDRLGGAINQPNSEPTAPTQEPHGKVKCKRCGRAFKRERLAQKYCCARCRNAAVKSRLRARSGDKKPSRRHLVLPHREAVTFGRKSPTKSKANLTPRLPDFRRPVIDLLDRPSLYADRPPVIAEDVRLRWADLMYCLVRDECANRPRRYRRPPMKADDDVVIEMDEDGFPIMLDFLRRKGRSP